MRGSSVQTPSQNIQPIEVWLARGAWAVVAFACLQILLFGYGRDQGIYAVVGEGLLTGKMPYRDVWDFKPPGIFFVYAAAQALFGKAMTSVRILECAGLVAMVLAFRRIGRELFGSAAAGLLGGAVAALIHAELEFWHTAQPESFGGMLTMAALALTVGKAVRRESSPGERIAIWMVVGVLFGAAFLCKPPLGGGAIMCAGYVAIAEYRAKRRFVAIVAPFVVMGLGSFLPIVVCALFFWAKGAWPALSWTLFEFTPGYTKLGWTGTAHGLFLYSLTETLSGFSYLLPAAIAFGIVLPAVHERERGGVLLVIAVFMVHGAGIALQAKFFQYHFGATLPVVSVVAGLGLYKTCRVAVRARVLGVAVWILSISWLVSQRDALRHNPGTFWERTADRMEFLFLRDRTREALDEKLYYVADYDLDVDRKAARRIEALTGANDSIFVWGFEPAIYWLSERRAASRYIYDVPQRATWQRDRARTELLSDLLRDPPRIVAVQHNDVFRFVTGDDLDSHAALETFPELARMIDGEYRLIESVEDVDLYARK